MNYLKTLLALFSICFFTNIFSQGLYVQAFGGYSAALNPYPAYHAKEILDTTNYIYLLKSHTTKYGQGINPGVSIGYMFDKKMGVELSASFHLGAKTKSEDVDYFDGEYVTFKFRESSQAQVLTVMLIMQSSYRDVNFYLKLGPSIGLASITHEEEYFVYNPAFEHKKEYRKYKESGGFAFGLQSAMGMEIPLNKKLSLVGEAFVRVLQYNPAKQEWLEYADENGNSLMDKIPEENRVFEYKKETESLRKGLYNAKEQPKVNFTINSLGARLGIRYSF